MLKVKIEFLAILELFGQDSSEITWVIQKYKFVVRPCSIFQEIVKKSVIFHEFSTILTIFHHILLNISSLGAWSNTKPIFLDYLRNF